MGCFLYVEHTQPRLWKWNFSGRPRNEFRIISSKFVHTWEGIARTDDGCGAVLIRCTAQYQSTFPTLGHHYFRGWPHKGGIDVSPSILLESPPHFWFSIQQTFTTKEILVSRMSNTVVVVFPEKGLKIDFPCGRRARPNADHCWGGSSQVPQPTL